MPRIINETDRGATLRVRVSAGARRDAITGVHAGALKVSVMKAPEKGKANKQVARILAQALDLRPARIEILRGLTSRDKVILVRDMSAKQLRALLVPFAQTGS